jgi:hypothetical protein
MNPSAVSIMRRLGLDPDPWQVEVLSSSDSRLLVNSCRQAGKTTTAAVLAIAEALARPHAPVLVLTRSRRHAKEVFGIVSDLLAQLAHAKARRCVDREILLANTSRIVVLPGQHDAIRAYANVKLLIVDEAARVPDSAYRAARVMLARSGGRLICLSTPLGKRGFFWNSWIEGGDDWRRVAVPAQRLQRISPAFLEEERRVLGEAGFRQEYCCAAC